MNVNLMRGNLEKLATKLLSRAERDETIYEKELNDSKDLSDKDKENNQ